MSRHPEVKWAERADKIFITVQLPDAKDAKVNLEPEGVFTFSATGAGGHPYELKLDLHDKVNVEESKINIGVRSIFCIIEKAEQGWWKRLLRGDVKPPHYIKVDWDKWADEDEDTGTGLGDMDLGGMDFSSLGGMGGDGMGMPGMGMPGMGMPGMGMPGMGMPGMGGGMGEFEDSDDEDKEISKPDGGATAEGEKAKIEEVKEA